MKAKALRELTAEELGHKIEDLREELFNLRFQSTTGHLEDSSIVNKLKKDIARCHTIKKEIELGLITTAGMKEELGS